MSPTTKRDADEAFGKIEAVPPSSTKRRRGKGAKRESDQGRVSSMDTLQKSSRLKGAVASPVQERNTLPVADGDLSGQPTPATDAGTLRKTSRRRHKKQKKAGPVDGVLPEQPVPKDEAGPPKDSQKKHKKVHIEGATDQQLVVVEDEAKADDRHRKKQMKEEGEVFGDKQVIIAKDGARPENERQKKQKLGRTTAREDRIMNALNQETPSDASEQDWDMSIAGGYFLDQDPILSVGDQYLILPTKSNIDIYSTATSLLVRSLPISLVDVVTSCIMCQLDPDHLLVSTRGGFLSKWNWTTGRKLREWRTKRDLLELFPIVAGEPPRNKDCIILLHNDGEGHRELSHCDLNQVSDRPLDLVGLRELHDSGVGVTSMDGGKILIVCVGDKLMFCSSSASLALTSPSAGTCVWREVTVPGKIVSFDARARRESSTAKSRLAVDVVVGLQDGAILVYDDILFKLIGKERGVEGAKTMSRRLHWHRDAVSSVKWSRDGNYLISGGRETVLVIWQLDTNQQQYLPHLAAPICKLAVSAAGSAYTIRLADNSVMVLSTADLRPTTNINGVSVGRGHGKETLVAVNPKEPDQLLLATATELALHSTTPVDTSTTMLQTYDMKSNHQVSRQALGRNISTVVNVNPKGEPVVDPDVVQLKISNDGLWLATVDEWTPSKSDIEPLQPHGADRKSKLDRTETHLRFWSRDERLKSWQTVTRIDQPHSDATHSVLQLAVNPTKAEFATAGADGCLRLWAPMLRTRNGMPVKDSHSQPLHSWVCVYALQPEPQLKAQQASSAALAYSEDGSVIAATWSVLPGAPRPIYFVDSRKGSIRASQSSLCSYGTAKLAFSGVYLLVLSDQFCVWDIVNAQLTFSISLEHEFGLGGGFLESNPVDQTFAIALNPPNLHDPAALAIFNAKRPTELLYQGKVHRHVKALLPAAKRQGYIVIDSEARIRQLKRGAAINKGSIAAPFSNLQAFKGLNNVFGLKTIANKEDGNISTTKPNAASASFFKGAFTSSSTKKSLDEVLEQQDSSATLPVSEVFEQVARLFARMPAST